MGDTEAEKKDQLMNLYDLKIEVRSIELIFQTSLLSKSKILG